MTSDPAIRIEQALLRIEAASAARAYSLERLQQRHSRLRERLQEAIASIDLLIAREPAESEE